MKANTGTKVSNTRAATNNKRAENKDNLDSRKNEEFQFKGDDVTHNQKDTKHKKIASRKLQEKGYKLQAARNKPSTPNKRAAMSSEPRIDRMSASVKATYQRWNYPLMANNLQVFIHCLLTFKHSL